MPYISEKVSRSKAGQVPCSGTVLTPETRDGSASLGIIMRKRQNSAGNYESTVALKLTGRVIQVRNRGYLVGQQSGPSGHIISINREQ